MYHGSFRKMLKETIHESQKCQRNWDLNKQIPEEDKNELENQGISGNFGPGTSMETIIDHINKSVKK